MAILELPLQNSVEAFEYKIELEGKIYFFGFTYNSRRKRWLMDIFTRQKIPILTNIALLTDVDSLSKYSYPELPPGLFLMLDTQNEQKNAEAEDLGARVLLLYDESVA